MTPDQERKIKAERAIEAVARAYRLAADEDQHRHRELGFSLWLERNPAHAFEVKSQMRVIGMRREWQR